MRFEGDEGGVKREGDKEKDKKGKGKREKELNTADSGCIYANNLLCGLSMLLCQ